MGEVRGQRRLIGTHAMTHAVRERKQRTGTYENGLHEQHTRARIRASALTHPPRHAH